MPNKIDFLQPDVSQIRHQIKNILDSYNHDWDLIAELAQNSVDAIRLMEPVKGHMTIEINAPDKRIVFEDNGCGISPDELPNLLAPFSSDKDQNPKLIGQKGVGISFVIFSSAFFQIETHHSDGSARASINGAWAWIDNQEEELPKLEFEKIPPNGKTGTEVSITLPQDSTYEFFTLSFEQLQMVIMTKTALGDTQTIWGKEPNKDVVLKFVNIEGQEVVRQFDCSYFLPISKLSRSQYISLREFQDWNKDNDRTDAQKRAKLRDKLVYIDGRTVKAGREIQYWSCFVPTRKAWDSISINSKLIGQEILDLNPLDRIDQFGDAEYLFSGGMYTSTRGMPTGIRSDMRPRGSAGYLPNFFIIVDDPQLTFDIGRKSIPGRQLGMLRNLASDVFRGLINDIKRYVSGEPNIDLGGWDRTAMFNEIREMPDLRMEKTKFLKRPASQEATVAAIFFELMGRGDLDGFQPYISGYKNKYDLYSKYMNSDVVVEFKFILSSLFNDFDNETKLFNEVDIVVVWEIIEKDYEVVRSRGFDLQEIDEGLSQGVDPIFHFILTIGPNTPIRIICLKNLLNNTAS